MLCLKIRAALPTDRVWGKANCRFTCHLTLEFLHRSKELYIIQKVGADRSCKTKLETANSMEY